MLELSNITFTNLLGICLLGSLVWAARHGGTGTVAAAAAAAAGAAAAAAGAAAEPGRLKFLFCFED